MLGEIFAYYAGKAAGRRKQRIRGAWEKKDVQAARLLFVLFVLCISSVLAVVLTGS